MSKMISSPSFLHIVSLLSLFTSFVSSSSSFTSITIPLSNFHRNPSPDTLDKDNLAFLASASIARAHHLKNPQSTSVYKTPLSSHSYGAYSISLAFGTPPQTIPFIMDTGSQLVWLPCTHRYLCRNCSSLSTSIPAFIPKQSSSTKILGCRNPKCGWVHRDTDPQSLCQDCPSTTKNCSQICPPYLILYGSGSTGGITLLETLDLPNRKILDFVVGCSLFSSRQPAGIAGFGRGPTSLPSQLGLKKFSFCHLSHKLDDTNESSTMLLDAESDSGEKSSGMSYTPFRKNPSTAERPSFAVYYYVGLRKIVVGGKPVEISYKDLELGSDGNGGTIVDSGSTFTFMSNSIFEAVSGAIREKVKKTYTRSTEVENYTGLRPCYTVSGHREVSMPEVEFHFKGGAQMVLPLENYFSVVGDDESQVVCFTMVTSDAVVGSAPAGGPAVIIGNYQLQNFHVEYDLRNERFGFRQQSSCS